jgi:hypothetical protein
MGKVDIMLSTVTYPCGFNSHFQLENVLLSTARQRKHPAAFESRIDSVHENGIRFVTGVLVVLPISALLWGLILFCWRTLLAFQFGSNPKL